MTDPRWEPWVLGGAIALLVAAIAGAFVMERRARRRGRENRRSHEALLRRADELARHPGTRPIADGLRHYLARRGSGRPSRRPPPP